MLIQLVLKYIKTDTKSVIEMMGYWAAHCGATLPEFIFLKQKLCKTVTK